MEGGGGTARAAASRPERREDGGVEDVGADYRLWGWGAGTDGQLGLGATEDELIPRPVRLPHPYPYSISYIACGGAHSIAITDDGKTMTWGRGRRGQLGHGVLENCLKPNLVESMDCCTISHVSAGWSHSGFVTDTGSLFTCGDGSFGQLGHGDRQSCSSSREVIFFSSMHVAQIACGMRHSLALIKGPSGDVIFGFGSGRHGQLGASDNAINRVFSLPKVVHHFANDSISMIYANGDNSAALTANGQLYMWGRGFNGRFSASVPQTVSSCKFSQIALGWNHALAVTEHGELFMIGGYHHGMLGSRNSKPEEQDQVFATDAGLGESSTVPLLRMVPYLGEGRIIHIAAGAEHSAFVTENGAIMTWGWGEHGQLGLGSTIDQTRPQLVNLGGRMPISQTRTRVYCGSGFTLASVVPCGC